MKRNRHSRILSLIKENTVQTQEQLLELLCKEGYDVTQATVSRDIRQLQLVKAVDAQGVSRYTAIASANQAPKFDGIFADAVISVVSAMNDVVVKCYPGTANAACAVIDRMNFKEIVGTLAGDDTIFIITSSEDAAISLKEKLDGLK